jgi:ribonuclease VapC
MIVDSSAIVAIVLREPGYEALIDKLGAASFVGIGVATLVETTIVLSAKLGRDARGLVARLLDEASIATVALSDAHYGVAVDAWLRFGKGRHAAALDFGDCLAYAVAKSGGWALLCVGDDFARTDLALA